MANFTELKKHHDDNYRNSLSGIIENQSVSPLKGSTAENQLVAMAEEDQAEVPTADMTELETVSELEETFGPFKDRCPCEEPDVELIRDKNDDEWMLSKKGRALQRGCHIGGYGTGKWVPTDAKDDGVALSWDNGDKTMIQAGLQ